MPLFCAKQKWWITTHCAKTGFGPRFAMHKLIARTGIEFDFEPKRKKFSD
jgi:hypothetical protein